jgi:hypothetical protein
MTATDLTQDKKAGGRALTHAAIVIVVGVLATTLAQTGTLARIPLQNLLKNELHVSRADNAAFFFWCGLAWYFKPLVGIVTDAFPVFGSRRKSYILIGSGMTVLAWAALYFTPHAYGPLLWVCMLAETFMVVASTVIGGYMVETAQARSGSGRLTALRQFVQQVCIVIGGPGSGYLASIAFGWTALASGGAMFLLIPATLLFLHERRRTIRSGEMLGAAGRQLKRIGSARTMWAAAGLMALFYVAPGFGTAVFYKQQNELHMNTQGQGTLALIAGVCGIGAAMGYAYACRRLNLRTLLMIGLLAATVLNLGYLFYSSVGAARVIEGLNSFGFSLAELALMDLAIRATPPGSEGLGFALMMAVRNFALFGTDWLGSTLLDNYHVPFNALVIANSATTLITVPLVLLLPLVLVKHKDAEIYEEPPAPRTAHQPG